MQPDLAACQDFQDGARRHGRRKFVFPDLYDPVKPFQTGQNPQLAGIADETVRLQAAGQGAKVLARRNQHDHGLGPDLGGCAGVALQPQPADRGRRGRQQGYQPQYDPEFTMQENRPHLSQNG
ncbi:MAG: hypothetical protein MUF67_13305 [Desulfobacterales bacterium]|nr:hypothetical protein [Desulfobacterales bacterium]